MDFELAGQRFNWRDEKAATNAVKHGVTFFEAAEALVDDSALIHFDEAHSSRTEER